MKRWCCDGLCNQGRICPKEKSVKEDYEGQGLERFWRTLLTFTIIGAVSLGGLSLYVLWRVFA
jgi:hypothetical protein